MRGRRRCGGKCFECGRIVEEGRHGGDGWCSHVLDSEATARADLTEATPTFIVEIRRIYNTVQTSESWDIQQLSFGNAHAA